MPASLNLEPLERRRLLSVYDIDLGALPGGISTEPADINASGQVVGTVILENGAARGFFWRSGVMTDLGHLGGGDTRAYGINDAGQIVGQSTISPSTYVPHAFLLTPEDTDGNGSPDRWFRDSNADGKNDLMRDLGGIGSYALSTAVDVNNLGQVVGQITDGISFRAFRWQSGVMTDMGTFGGANSTASAINDAGQIAGLLYGFDASQKAFLWKNGVMTDLGVSNGPADLNATGHMVDKSPRMWTPTAPNGASGSFSSLGQLPPVTVATYVFSTALGISASNHVVGYQTDVYSTEFGETATLRGMRWTNGVPQELPIELASAINDAGQIVGARGGRGVLLSDESLLPPLLTISGTSVPEGNSGTHGATMTVNLTRASTQTVSVQYATLGGAAAAGSDYVATSGTLTFAPGQTSRTLTVTVLGDRVPEYFESQGFTVALSNPTNALIAGAGSAFGGITDDEPFISGSSSSVTVVEGNAGATSALVTVKLSTPYDQPVTLAYETRDGSAYAVADYVPASGTVTFAAGETTRQFSVSVVGDRVAESDIGAVPRSEFFTFAGSSPSGNASVAHIGNVIIEDDEPVVFISLEPVTATEGAAGGGHAVVFTVALSKPYDQEVTVDYVTAEGYESTEYMAPAVEGSDYVRTTGTLHFAPGQISRTVSVPVIGDAVVEWDEYFYLFLNTPSGNAALTGYMTGVGEILDDDGAVKTWIGPASGGNWSTAANWSPAGVPAADDAVAIDGKSVILAASAGIGSLNLTNGASLTVAASGNRVLRASSLSVSGDSTLNLSDNDLILDYSGVSPVGVWTGGAYDGVSGLVKSGRILSSAASATPTALAVAEARDALGITGNQTTLWNGQTVDSTSVLIKYSYGGDANLDGKINIDDYGQIDANLGSSGGVFGYFAGDFNYDGKINIDDYGIIDGSVAAQGSPL